MTGKDSAVSQSVRLNKVDHIANNCYGGMDVTSPGFPAVLSPRFWLLTTALLDIARCLPIASTTSDPAGGGSDA